MQTVSAIMTGMNGRWVVLQHAAWEGPGIIAREARKRGFEIEVRRLDREDALPDADHLGGLVVMGGPFGAYEEDRYPFLARECKLLEEVVRRGRPLLGVCLGAQLLAKALGGKVFPGDGAEIGLGSVNLTPAGQEDPLFAGSGRTLPVFHWHGDTFTLPEGAELLASTPRYQNQAFRFGNQTYGLQFHLEPDAEVWAAWRDHLPMDVTDGFETKGLRIEETGKKIISQFFDHVMKTAGIEPQ